MSHLIFSFSRRRAIAIGAALVLAASAGASVAWAGSVGGWRSAWTSRTPSVLTSVAATGTRGAWATGILYKGATPIRGFAIRWNGASWVSMPFPSQTGVFPMEVAASSAGNVWVAEQVNGQAQGRLVRWDGHRWHPVPTPGSQMTGNLVVLSASNAWTSGGGACPGNHRPNTCTPVWHWNGASWTAYYLPTDVAGLAGIRTGAVYAVGMNSVKPTANQPDSTLVAYHWNGRRWLWIRMPHPRINSLPGIDALSSSNVWIGAWPGSRQGAFAGTFALHWNGLSWQKHTVPAGVFASPGVVADGHGGAWLGPWEHWNGHAWQTIPLPSYDGRSWNVAAMARIPGTSSVWAAGTVSRTSSGYGVILINGRKP